MFASWWENCDKPRQCVEKQRRYSAAKGPSSQGYGLPSHQYHCESWTAKKVDTFELWCWRKLLRVPWTARKPNQSILREINLEYSLEGLMLKLKLQYWSSDANSWLIGKVPDAGKDQGQDKRASEDEMSRRHHRCNGHKLEQTSGDGERQGGLICCSPWGLKELDSTGWLNNNNSRGLPDPEVEPTSLAPSALTGRFFTTASLGKPSDYQYQKWNRGYHHRP